MPGAPEGREAVGWLVTQFRGAVPDLHAEVGDPIVEGDKPVARSTWSGTQQGELFDMPATGTRRAEARGRPLHRDRRVRTGIMVIDIPAASDLPRIAEPWSLAFDASVGFQPQIEPAPAGPRCRPRSGAERQRHGFRGCRSRRTSPPSRRASP